MSPTIDRVCALVFDVDNCLISCPSSDNIVLDVLRRHGCDSAEDELLETISSANSDWAIMERCLPPGCRTDAYAEILRANAEIVASSECDPALPGVLRDLAVRYSLFILSGRDRSSIDAAVRLHEIQDIFIDVIGAGLDGAEKPDPRDLLALLARHQIEPTRAVYIGDKLVDQQLAEAAGTRFICASWYEDLLPDARVKALSISELAAFFR